MKPIFALLLVVFAFSCSPEKIQEIQTNFIIQVMTDGQWKVSTYNQGTTSKTADFANYKFQFKNNNTVDAMLISNNSVSATGTWSADADKKTITSNFAIGSAAALLLLNGTWTITKNSLTYVEATQTINGTELFLRLDKIQ